MQIMSQDGQTIGEYQLITIKKIHGGKNDPKYGLYGYCPTGSADWALFKDPMIGGYESEERARRELEAVFAAMERGDRTYRLK